MRWFWIDRFIEFESGRRAVATKGITLVEEQMEGYGPWLPLMPASLIIEGLAQAGGLLVGEHNAFQERVVLAKIGKAVFHRPAIAGDTLTYTTVVENMQADGAICKGTSHIGDQLHAEIDLVFAHLDDRFLGVDQFEPADFLRLLRLLRLYEVGRTADGQPLKIPDHLLQAEQADCLASD